MMELLPAVSFFILLHLLTNSANAKDISGKIKLRLHRKSDKSYHEAGIDEGIDLFEEDKGYHKDWPIILIIHGMAMGADSYFVNGLVKAYIKRGLHHEYNIFTVDMPKLFQNNIFNNFYFGVLSNVQPAGEKIGELFNEAIKMNLTSADKMNLVGYSIGAQVAGYCARYVLNSYGPVNYIAGLDPAGPGFHSVFGHVPRLTHVSRDDANTAHFYHTNSGMCGTVDRVGTADFVFNDGTTQPGCTRESSLDCSHTRIPFLYIEAVAHPKKLVGRQCSSWEDFANCQCIQQETVRITFPPDSSSQGTYYLRTNDKSPFGMGRAGAYCKDTMYEESNWKQSKFSQKLQQASKPFETNVFENHRNHNLEKQASHKNLKSDFNVRIISGIKKVEDLKLKKDKSV